MEIKILKIENLDNKSNFQIKSDLFKSKSIMLSYNQIYESVANPTYSFKNCKFEEKLIGKLYLTYPLSVICTVDIEVNSLNELIQKIAEAYNKIYNDLPENKKYGIWGHSIYDLSIHTIKIYTDNSITVELDS